VPVASTITLPTKPERGEVDWTRKKTLLYGPPKVGKSTLIAELDPENTLFLATEPGHDHLEIMRWPVNRWEDFLTIGAALKEHFEEQGKAPYKLLAIDTVDELARMCGEAALQHLAATADKGKFLHASDFEYGKGWDAIADEFRRKVAGITRMGMGVVFISHEKETTVELANGATVLQKSPDVGIKSLRKWLLGYVDYILHAEIGRGGGRLIRAQPTANILAGGRVPKDGEQLPDTFQMDAGTLRRMLERVA
jgi:hypothetical protein